LKKKDKQLKGDDEGGAEAANLTDLELLTVVPSSESLVLCVAQKDAVETLIEPLLLGRWTREGVRR